MGVKTFSKVFDATQIVAVKDLAGKKIAIDAMTEIYRAALGAKSVKTLTDRHGNPTMHISVILANLIEMQRYGIEMIWVFDYDRNGDQSADFHNPAKLNELLKRQKRKKAAQDKLAILRKKQETEEEVLFSDSDSDDEVNEHASDDDNVVEEKQTQQQVDQLEKQEFSATSAMINDVKLILNCLNVKYVEAPSGFEGEQVAANMASAGIVDGVYSGDTDPIPFGSPVLYRRARDKKIYMYEQEEIFQQIVDGCPGLESAGMDELLKVCLILGCDFSEKTKGVGPKTVFKKMAGIELTDDQIQNGLAAFESQCDVSELVINNANVVPFTDCTADSLFLWLTEERSFTKKRIDNWFDKVMDRSGESVVALPPAKVKKTMRKVAVNPKASKSPATTPKTKAKAKKTPVKRKMPPKKGEKAVKAKSPRQASKSPTPKPEKPKKKTIKPKPKPKPKPKVTVKRKMPRKKGDPKD